ncbi:MAG: mechanosensitive ion channel [Desulfobulbaceae bacterium]|nr:mechanosensitive ion channel [Desulfobulbaceae bacterium]
MKVSARFLTHLALLLVLLLLPLQQGLGAEATEPLSDAQLLVSADTLKAKAKEIEQTSGLEENSKKQLLEFYRMSLENLDIAASQEAQSKKYVQVIETAPADIKKIRDGMNKLAHQPDLQTKVDDLADEVPLKDIEQQLLLAKAAYAAAEADVAALTRQLASLNEKPVKSGQRLAVIKESVDELVATLTIPSPATENPQITEARRWLQQTQMQAFHSESRMLNQELISMPVLVELANAQRDAAAERLEEARSQVLRLEAKANRKRQDEATLSMGQAQEAMRQVADSYPILQQAAAANATLGDELQKVTTALEQMSTEKDTLEKDVKNLEESFRNTKQKIELAGLSQAIGLLLFEQRRSLPDGRLLQKKTAQNEMAIAETGLLQVQYREERKQLDDMEGYTAKLAADTPQEVLAKIGPELKNLLASRRNLLDKIIASNQSYLSLLAELEASGRQLLKAVVAFDNYLAERLLWLRGTPFMRLKDFASLPHEAAVLFAPGPWLATGKLIGTQVVTSPFFLLAGLLTIVLHWGKRSLQGALETAVRQAGNPASYNFALPLQALGSTLLLALPGPLLLMILGWQLHIHDETTEFSSVLAMGLMALAYRYFLLRAFRLLVLPKGLASGFFHWQKSTLSLLRRETGLFIVTFLPAILLTQIAFWANFRAGGSHILGRLTFIATLIILAFALYRVLHPKTGVWHRYLTEHASQFLARLYPLFFLLIVSLPVVMSGLVLAGYVFAVAALIRCLINSVWLAVGLAICHQLIERWLIQSSRRLALQKTLSLRAQAKVDRHPERLALDKESGPIVEPTEDLFELSAESRKLLDTATALALCFGLWAVWAEVLPALRIFNEFTLWGYTAQINGQATIVPVTLADAGLVILIGIITLTATRHFPSLLKIVLLQHLDMTPGSRYTATTLTRYLIGGTGLMTIANILGFSWSQIQWLVAALGVGIGFGLQEIVANFISGLIILFERPIRVGDVVTIGTTDGVVTRIRIRATTIRDFDRKELLVPNKEFISGRLLNWSLSDPVIRLLLPVGIAYGSDVQLAMTLMKQAAEENSLVLEDPKPAVTFDSFGDNSLLLTLRCFIGNVDDRVPAKSALHQVIDQKFRVAEISMAFPQRDVHLDTNRPLDIRLVQEKGAIPNKVDSGAED